MFSSTFQRFYTVPNLQGIMVYVNLPGWNLLSMGSVLLEKSSPTTICSVGVCGDFILGS